MLLLRKLAGAVAPHAVAILQEAKGTQLTTKNLSTLGSLQWKTFYLFLCLSQSVFLTRANLSLSLSLSLSPLFLYISQFHQL
jgi:hypothetical protein